MAIHGIDGQFWSGKSSFCAKIADIVQGDNVMIFTNIKFNKKRIRNVYEFEDHEILKVLRTINAINDFDRLRYGQIPDWWELPNHLRHLYTRFYVFYSESGSLLWNETKLKEEGELRQYINQNRKNFMEFFLDSASGGQNTKTIRARVDKWYVSRPWFNIPILRDFRKVEWQHREEDWETLKMVKYLARDEKGDYVVKEYPDTGDFMVYYAPFVWSLYDDLHKNIKDPLKYVWADLETVKAVLEKTWFDFDKFLPEKHPLSFIKSPDSSNALID